MINGSMEKAKRLAGFTDNIGYVEIPMIIINTPKL